jgi:hypothetical protein
VLDKDDGRGIGRHGMDDAVHGEFFLRRNAGGRLVQQQQFRPAHQRHGDVDQLAHAARQFRDRAIGEIGKAEALQQFDRLVAAALRLRRRVK